MGDDPGETPAFQQWRLPPTQDQVFLTKSYKSLSPRDKEEFKSDLQKQSKSNPIPLIPGLKLLT